MLTIPIESRTAVVKPDIFFIGSLFTFYSSVLPRVTETSICFKDLVIFCAIILLPITVSLMTIPRDSLIRCRLQKGYINPVNIKKVLQNGYNLARQGVYMS